MFKISRENFYIILLMVILILELISNRYHIVKNTFKQGLPLTNKVFVIDAGHGGKDAGTSGKLEKKEKNLNLEVALKLQQYLEQAGAYVILTRADDNGLYDESARNKKANDLAKRKEIFNNSKSNLIISVHQNNYSEEQYNGAQVFYKSKCEVSKNVAKHIQTELKSILNKNNDRVEKPTMEYYLFKNSKIPIVLIECGFLSNTNEEIKLNDTEYQEKMAWAIYKGISDYYIELKK